MAKKKENLSSTEKVYVLFDPWEDPVFSGTLDEVANYLSGEDDADLSEYTLHELGPKLNFKYVPPKIIL